MAAVCMRQTRTTVRATGKSGMIWLTSIVGIATGGRPWGSAPRTATPFAGRSSAAEATSERIRPMSAPGIFGLIFSLTMTMARTTTDIAIAYQFQSAYDWTMWAICSA